MMMIMKPYTNEQLYKTFAELELLDQKKLDEVYLSAKTANQELDDILLRYDLITDETLGKVVAQMLNLPLVRLSQTSIPDDILRTIPEIVARKQHAIVFKLDPKGLHIGLDNPKNTQIAEFIHKKTGLPVNIYYATKRDIEGAFNNYHKNVAEAFEDIIKHNIENARSKKNQEPSITKIVETIILYAYENKSSDIHIEPFENYSRIRFRIDGILHDIVHLPKEIHAQIVSRIKVLSSLRIDEHFTTQDGKLAFKTEYENVNIRVSIAPVTAGEKIVMRLLSERSRQFSLRGLGFSESDFRKVQSAYERPYGLILSTGPTGSGKTTSLYAIIKILNKGGVNIMTIEDPVEYDIEGINQMQVNVAADLTFAKGLRSIVRQDPDIILVGEIRDEETAGIAINSAMTGHLVLSTMHTIDTATAIPRFYNMKVEPFLIGSTVNVIIAQRLIRTICGKCRVSYELSIEKLANQVPHKLLYNQFGDRKQVRLYHGKGCAVCHNTGYSGRLGIFEVMTLNDEIRNLIILKKNAQEIKKASINNGMITMLQDGLEKVNRGITTVDEVLRVIKE